MGSVSSTQRLTVDCISLMEQLEPSQLERQSKIKIRRIVEQLLRKIWKSCRVIAFGSSESGFAFGASDLDLGIYFCDQSLSLDITMSHKEKIALLAKVAGILKSCFEISEFVQSARVPLLKLWSGEYQIACDLCIGSKHVLLNTAMMRYYGEVDLRIRPLLFAIKYWAKHRGISDPVNGTLSSYGYSLLLIFYLKFRMRSKNALMYEYVYRQEIDDCDDLDDLLKKLRNIPLPAARNCQEAQTCSNDSIGAMLYGFFRFYASEFDHRNTFVSLRQNSAAQKPQKANYSVSWRFSIEDPFKTEHDVARVIFDKKGQDLIMEEFKRAADMLQLGCRLKMICELDATSWQAVSTCYICNGKDHRARHCMQRYVRQMSDTFCWYCGHSGHTKFVCPLYRFLRIPQTKFAKLARAESQAHTTQGNSKWISQCKLPSHSLPYTMARSGSFPAPDICYRKKRCEHIAPIPSEHRSHQS